MTATTTLLIALFVLVTVIVGLGFSVIYALRKQNQVAKTPTLIIENDYRTRPKDRTDLLSKSC